jgi:hypothetical protein
VDEAAAQAFWARVKKAPGENTCWPWVGGWVDEYGRGRWRMNGRTVIASRAALILSKGPPPPSPEELHACHTCDTPACCRPEHLFWGTREQNMQDMARKGRAGMQRHPERYRRPRRPDVPYRPVKQPDAPKGIDRRTWTRMATPQEQALAGRALEELESQHNRITLVPAPDPHFDSHKIRVVESRNPQWYIDFGAKYWRGTRQFDLKRARVTRALKRVVAGRMRGNGYERVLLPFLAERWPEVKP